MGLSRTAVSIHKRYEKLCNDLSQSQDGCSNPSPPTSPAQIGGDVEQPSLNLLSSSGGGGGVLTQQQQHHHQQLQQQQLQQQHHQLQQQGQAQSQSQSQQQQQFNASIQSYFPKAGEEAKPFNSPKSRPVRFVSFFSSLFLFFSFLIFSFFSFFYLFLRKNK